MRVEGLDAEFRRERIHAGLGAPEIRTPAVDVCAVGIALRHDAAADAGAGFQNEDVLVRGVEGLGGGETGIASADDDAVVECHVCARIDLRMLVYGWRLMSEKGRG